MRFITPLAELLCHPGEQGERRSTQHVRNCGGTMSMHASVSGACLLELLTSLDAFSVSLVKRDFLDVVRRGQHLHEVEMHGLAFSVFDGHGAGYVAANVATLDDIALLAEAEREEELVHEARRVGDAPVSIDWRLLGKCKSR